MKPLRGYRVVRADTVAELEQRIDETVVAVEKRFDGGTVTIHGGVAVDFIRGGYMQALSIKYEDYNR